MRILLFCLLLFLYHSYSFAQESAHDYGLHINSYPVPASEYTSFVLEQNDVIKLQDKKLGFKFDLWVRPDNVIGTVYRIITNNNINVDLIYSVGKNDERNPILVIGDKIYSIQKQVHREKWVAVALEIDPSSGQVSFVYDGQKTEVTRTELLATKSVRISFGSCPFEDFSVGEVASVNVRNVGIEKNNKPFRFWKLAEHDGDTCYDELAKVPAAGSNTKWLIDKYITWQKIFEAEYDYMPSIAFDSVNTDFFLAYNNKNLYRFNAVTKQYDTISVTQGDFVGNFPNQLVFIDGSQSLVSYNIDAKRFATFNKLARSWEGDTATVMEHDYWNNSMNYHAQDSALISFGGYGHYMYNNQLVLSFPFHPNKPQEKLTLSEISPRYTPSSTIVGNILYVFGGRGSASGHQELSPQNFYDLYAVDLKTREIKKMWESEVSPVEGDFVPGENMVYDKEKKCFYIFTTWETGTLMKLNADGPTVEIMSKPMGLNFGAQYIYTNLFLSASGKKLYSAIILSDAKGKTKVEIYEITYPPVPIQQVEQNMRPSVSGFLKNNTSAIIGAGVLLILLTILFFRKNKKQTQLTLNSSDRTVPTTELASQIDIAIDEQPALPQHYDFSKSCIALLGGFKVSDKSGNDISAAFSPTLKSLLIIIILYTEKNAKGIHGNKIIQYLWGDRSEDSAKNNRNVYMSKLRTLLDEVGNVKILNQNGFWSIQTEDGAFCDYLETMQIFQEKNNDSLPRLLELLLRGELLPDFQQDWVDEFKSRFSNTAIDLLTALLKNSSLPANLQLMIADAIFKYDFLNEEALQAKCSLLHNQGKHGLAKSVYDNFCHEYHLSLGINYTCTFLEVVEKKCAKDGQSSEG